MQTRRNSSAIAMEFRVFCMHLISTMLGQPFFNPFIPNWGHNNSMLLREQQHHSPIKINNWFCVIFIKNSMAVFLPLLGICGQGRPYSGNSIQIIHYHVMLLQLNLMKNPSIIWIVTRAMMTLNLKTTRMILNIIPSLTIPHCRHHHHHHHYHMQIWNSSFFAVASLLYWPWLIVRTVCQEMSNG